MADIIDALVVSLGIDATEYDEQIKKYRNDRKKLDEENETSRKKEAEGQRKATDGIRTLRNETAGFLLMLAGANSLKNFVGNLLTGDAATGRFAANIGMATERLSVWENALKQVGGTSQDAQSSMRALSTIFQNYQLLGDNSKSGDLAFFGLSERDLADPEKAMMRLAERGEGLKGDRRAEYTMRLNRLGLNDSTVTLLAQGRGPLEKMLKSIEAAGVATDESAKAAQDLEAELAKTAQTIQGEVRPALTELTKLVVDLTAGFRKLLKVSDRLTEMWNWFTGGKMFEVKDSSGSGAGAALGDMAGAALGGGSSGGGPLGAVNGLLGGLGFAPIEVPSAGGGRAVRASGSRNAQTIERYFREKGFSDAQARGITAAIVAEGGIGRRTGGGYKGRTIGIGQLLGSRRAKFLKRYGANFTLQNELDFFYEEMHNSDGGNVGGKVRRSNDSRAIARMMVDDFYRPAQGAETIGDYRRADGYLRQPTGARPAASAAAPKVNQTNSTTVGTIVIHTAGKDSDTIARDMRAALAERGLVVQAASGLKP